MSWSDLLNLTFLVASTTENPLKHIYFITHPNVLTDPEVPVPQWSLSERGFERMNLMLKQTWTADITSIYCSDEQKAIGGAQVLAKHLSLAINQRADLGENDRSATGFLEPGEFESVADQFFANPNDSIRGWETAQDAQNRIISVMNRIIAEDASLGSLAVVSHGAVGTLLLCHLAAHPIDRKYDQPGAGGGNYFVFEASSRKLLRGWEAIDTLNE